jgi:uncharacterized repeat protein (TIGR01451 family)
MRNYAWTYGLSLLLLVFATSAEAQRRAEDGASGRNAPAIPIVRVTVENPPEINLGKAATFNIVVTNQGNSVANEVVVVTSIPKHAELTKTTPEPVEVEGRIAKFLVGDLPPGATRRVTLVTIPRSKEPIRLNATTTFNSSTQSTLIVRQPALQLTAQVSPQAEIGTEVDWVIRVTNTGDGPADDVVVTPNLIEGTVQGTPLKQSVKIGSLKAGETKEVQFTVIPTVRGKVAAKFVGSNADGLESTKESVFKALQAHLAVAAVGPTVQPLAREGNYEIRVTNPGDATAGSTMVVVKIPTGLEVTATTQDAYDRETRTLRWRITKVRPSDVVRLPFRAETIAAGNQTLEVVVKAERIEDATAKLTTNVISRSNFVVTVLSDQELAAISEPIGFRVTVINAGSKTAEDLSVRVAMPEGMQALESSDYQVKGDQIEFPLQKLASGEKVTLAFRAKASRVGEHRVRVLVNGGALSSELSFEGSTFCYKNDEVPVSRSTQGDSPNDA